MPEPANISTELLTRPVVQALQALAPGALLEAAEFRGQLTLVASAPRLGEVCELLRSQPELRYNFLADLTAVDRYPVEPRFEVVYHLKSLSRNDRVRLKVRLSGDEPRIESVLALWPAANMLEREVYDLFGVRFSGHPNLRRLLMPDDWEGFPLRKDYPVEGYR